VVITRSFVAGVLWGLFALAVVLTGFAISGAWGGGDGKHYDFGQRMAVISSIAGSLILVTVILGAVALRYTRFVESSQVVVQYDDDDGTEADAS
jgi:TRAP-type C4-dicarboxylate transport system permease large subunit